MKLFRKLAAAALAGVMALSLLTGCALGDAAKENAMLKALQTIGNSYQVKVAESDSLSKKASGIFAKFKEAGEEAWDVENLPDDFSPTGKKVTYNDVEYMIVVLKMPKNAKDSTKWGYPAELILQGLEDCVETDKDGNDTLKVGFDVMNDAKLTDAQEKAEDYMVVFAKCLDSGTGSGSHA